ncbi:MAG: choice-of-anchor H family protein [Gammaproteobacteria bacterium]|nr:choice-of-anchor H family protein [Gammaproteobacteria bacterium]MBU2675707.1 choice-of-anchor H family protein [Gammaproteobacteria bacterium]NNC56876.1 GlyGly-CTERM sorting domain-containing protein [Woeseiaceae bacterium]NNL49445.1 GlyGly-CTERM sorting domain-containing protein [Woeseiaceae bacterium]
MNYAKGKKPSAFGLPVAMALLVIAGQPALASDDEERISVTSEGLVSQGGAKADMEPSTDEYGALTLSGARNKPTRSKDQQKTSVTNAAAPNTDFWFYTADVELFSDQDRDGYYAGINLLFDADTYYDVADVYAVLYLSYEYGDWNEYAETETFTIFGTSASDEYIVETDLVAGYPTGNYDILIELYDAYDNAFVASIGPDETSELAILPLEDLDRDAPAPGTTQIVVNSGGGGSLSWFLLLGLTACLVFRRRAAPPVPALHHVRLDHQEARR